MGGKAALRVTPSSPALSSARSKETAESASLDKGALPSSSIITFRDGGPDSLLSLPRPSKLKKRGRAAAPPGRFENEGSYDINDKNTRPSICNHKNSSTFNDADEGAAGRERRKRFASVPPGCKRALTLR